MGGPGATVRIEPLTATTWPALEAFFRKGGDPRWCWCQYWRLRSKDFAASRVPELRDRLRAAADGPVAPGLVALRDGAAVGWVSLGPRDTFERIERSRVIPRIDDTPVWSVVCFAVEASARGEGVGAALLDAAVAYAAANGAMTLEAYPVELPAGGALPAESAFTGTLAMFERVGFTVVADTTSSAGGHPRVVVRRAVRHLSR
ncbi:MAG TPA: GNAT family N-acetyltransferase [Candidatus Limnocylindrales bacterium]|nr:GNAT family N-acetyltransferase [Candidatus Limnocylindrales bacterium]